MRTFNGRVFIRGFWTASLLASAAWFISPGMAEAVSLKESVSAAINSNPEIGVVRADRRAVDQELRQARGGVLPSIDFRGDAGGEYTDSPSSRNRPSDDNTLFRRQAQLTLTQLLFDGFETAAEIARQKHRVDSAAYRVEESSEFIGLDAIEAHLEVLRNQEVVVLNEANLERHRYWLDRVQEQLDEGFGNIADLRQTEARVANAVENLAGSKGNLADAEAQYISVVGMAPVQLELGNVPLASLPVDREAAAAEASTNSPTVKIAAADTDVAGAEARGSRSGFYPRFDFELGGSAAGDVDGVEGNDYGASALVVMRYNLYRGGADIAREREAFHRINESRAQLRSARRSAEQDARVSVNALETARARTAASLDRVEAQRRTRDAYAEQFTVGTRDLLDLLDSENELLLARVSLVTAQYTQRFAVYRILAVIGSLTDTMDLQLSRETISINRSPEDVQTPEAIDMKSLDKVDPLSEPRPLRGQEAGEPPTDAPDVSDAINGTMSSIESEDTVSLAAQSEPAPIENTVAVQPAGLVEKPASGPTFQEQIGGFFESLVKQDGNAEIAETSQTVTAEPAVTQTVTANAEPVIDQPAPVATPQVAPKNDDQLSYFKGLFNQLTD